MKDRLIYKEPVAWILPILIFAYFNLEILNYLSNFPFAIILEFAWAIIVFQAIVWADSYEPEPYLAMVWTILAGASLSILITDIFYRIEGDQNYGMLYVGIIEEFAKAASLVAIFKSKLIHSWIDGYVYGALVGVGFSISEDFLYASSEVDPVTLVLARGMESIFAHSLFSGLVGAGVAFAFANKHKIGLLYAVFGVMMHVGWNTVLFLYVSDSQLVVFLLTPLIFAVFAFELRKIEKDKIVQACEILRTNGELTDHEFHLITNLSYRKANRKNYNSASARREFDQSINKIITEHSKI